MNSIQKCKIQESDKNEIVGGQVKMVNTNHAKMVYNTAIKAFEEFPTSPFLLSPFFI